MRHLRLFSIFLLLTFLVTGCHHEREEVVPPPQAQAPIVTTLPPMPPLTFPDVQLAKPEPAPPPVQATTPAKPEKPPVKRVRRHYRRHKAPAEPANATETSSGTAAPAQTNSTPANSGTTLLGQLSADDAAVSPSQSRQTERLIHRTENRLGHLSHAQQVRNADTIAQVKAFLDQAKQALTMKDESGAKTLANKAKILLDELR